MATGGATPKVKSGGGGGSGGRGGGPMAKWHAEGGPVTEQTEAERRTAWKDATPTQRRLVWDAMACVSFHGVPGLTLMPDLAVARVVRPMGKDKVILCRDPTSADALLEDFGSELSWSSALFWSASEEIRLAVYKMMPRYRMAVAWGWFDDELELPPMWPTMERVSPWRPNSEIEKFRGRVKTQLVGVEVSENEPTLKQLEATLARVIKEVHASLVWAPGHAVPAFPMYFPSVFWGTRQRCVKQSPYSKAWVKELEDEVMDASPSSPPSGGTQGPSVSEIVAGVGEMAVEEEEVGPEGSEAPVAAATPPPAAETPEGGRVERSVHQKDRKRTWRKDARRRKAAEKAKAREEEEKDLQEAERAARREELSRRQEEDARRKEEDDRRQAEDRKWREDARRREDERKRNEELASGQKQKPWNRVVDVRKADEGVKLAEEAKAKAEEALRLAKQLQTESRGAVGKGGVGAPRPAAPPFTAAPRSFRGRGGGRGASWSSGAGAVSLQRPGGVGPAATSGATWRGARGGFRGGRGSGQGPRHSHSLPPHPTRATLPPPAQTSHAQQHPPPQPQIVAPPQSAPQHPQGPVSLNPNLQAALEGLFRALVPPPVASSSPVVEPSASNNSPAAGPVRYLATDFREHSGAQTNFNVIREVSSPALPMSSSAPSNPEPRHPAPSRSTSSRLPRR